MSVDRKTQCWRYQSCSSAVNSVSRSGTLQALAQHRTNNGPSSQTLGRSSGSRQPYREYWWTTMPPTALWGIHWHSVGWVLGQHHRRWPITHPTQCQRLLSHSTHLCDTTSTAIRTRCYIKYSLRVILTSDLTGSRANHVDVPGSFSISSREINELIWIGFVQLYTAAWLGFFPVRLGLCTFNAGNMLIKIYLLYREY